MSEPEEKRMRLPGEQALDDPIMVETDGEWNLIGSRCTQCRTVYFPPRRLCALDLSECTNEVLPRSGTIYEAVAVQVAPEGFDPPYWVAYVDLPVGVRVFAPLEWHGDAEPHHGATVRYTARVVQETPYQVIGPVFAGPEADSSPPSE